MQHLPATLRVGSCVRFPLRHSQGRLSIRGWLPSTSAATQLFAHSGVQSVYRRRMSSNSIMSRVEASPGAQADNAPVQHLDRQVEVAIITTVGCQFCKRAKECLHKAQIPFQEIEASNQVELLKRVKHLTGRKTVPQVVSSLSRAVA